MILTDFYYYYFK